jgi:hypothetical protein
VEARGDSAHGYHRFHRQETTEAEVKGVGVMANPEPGNSNRGAFKRGWKQGVMVRNGERPEYHFPDNATWDAIGYRHGKHHDKVDNDEMERAWEWSKKQIKESPDQNVDVDLYYQ